MASLKFDEAVRLAARISAEITKIVGDSAAEIIVRDCYMTPRALWIAKELPGLLRLSLNDQPAWDAVKMIVQRELRSGAPLSPDLAAWVSNVLDGKNKRPAKQRALLLRNLRIVGAVQALVDCGFDATRNTKKTGKKSAGDASAEGGSACDAVGVALEKERARLGYKAVEGIWLACPQASRERFRDYYLNWGIRRPTRPR